MQAVRESRHSKRRVKEHRLLFREILRPKSRSAYLNSFYKKSPLKEYLFSKAAQAALLKMYSFVDDLIGEHFWEAAKRFEWVNTVVNIGLVWSHKSIDRRNVKTA